MEAKVKGTLSYHGNLSDFAASKRGTTWLAGWLAGGRPDGKSWWSQGCCSCRCLHSCPKHCGEEEKKEYVTWAKPVQEEEMLLCKVSDLWSFKIKVPMLTYLKQTQLSNPQKYKFDFIEKEKEKEKKLGEKEGSWEDLGKWPSILGVGSEHSTYKCIVKAAKSRISPVWGESVMSV